MDESLLVTLNVPQTGSLTDWQIITAADLSLTDQSEARLRLEFVGSFRLDWIRFVRQIPYSGGPSVIPGRIELEDYDIGGQHIAYFDDSGGNIYGKYRSDDVDIYQITGGYAVMAAEGEWLEYTANLPTGSYDIVVRSSSPHPAQSLELSIDGQLLTVFNLPSTGGWINWQSTSANQVYIDGGTNKVFRMTLTSLSSMLDSIQFVRLYSDGDIDHSGQVDLEDFSNLASQWQMTPQTPSVDIAQPANGIVDLYDLMVVVENWLHVE